MNSIKHSLILVLTGWLFTLNAQLRPGFVREQVADGLDPTKITLAPDGRIFMAEKYGAVRIIENGQLQTAPFLELEVDNFNERGLLGIAIDPNFEDNGYIYVFYTVKGKNHNRVSRFTSDGNQALVGSERILLDIDPMVGTVHNGGGMAFAPDGTLFIATGDGSNPATAQQLDNLHGKILRIRPDGMIPTDNPFYEEASGRNRAIWATGFRNPFTFDIQSVTGRMFVNDVGNAKWEEINEVVKGGNYGWPITEGKSDGQALPDDYQEPIYTYDHEAGCAITGAAFYNPSVQQFPERYRGKFFFGDYCNGYIKVFNPDTYEVEEDFAWNIFRPIGMLVAPNGDLYHLERAGIQGDNSNTQSEDGILWRILQTGSGAPFIAVQPNSVLVPVGEDAIFKVAVYGNAPLQFQWFKNGEIIAGENEATLVYRNVQMTDDTAEFSVTIGNEAGRIVSQVATLSVTANSRPNPNIILSATTTTYAAGDTIFFAGKASDREEGELDASAYTWAIDFHHDEHTHPAMNAFTGASKGYYVTAINNETDDNVWYRIYLTATDSEGLSQTTFQDVQPEKVQFEVRTTPQNLDLNVDGSTFATPYTVTSVKGIRRNITAPRMHAKKDHIYLFEQWGNGYDHNLYTLLAAENMTPIEAKYKAIERADGTGLLGRYFKIENDEKYPFPSFIQVDSVINFNWAFESPDERLEEYQYAMEWLGEIVPLVSDVHTFHLFADDGVRLYINDEKIIDQWKAKSAQALTGEIALEAGRRYSIRLEYKEHAEWSWGILQLFWSADLLPKSIIPQSQLYPAFDDGKNISVAYFPNPVQDEFTLRFTKLDEIGETIHIRLLDVQGSTLVRKTFSLEKGVKTLPIDTKNLPIGIYFVEISGDTYDDVIKVLKVE
ncbi:MAG: PQQ-dependent sugar dehydrogenase [Bacteroidota bacterium]